MIYLKMIVLQCTHTRNIIAVVDIVSIMLPHMFHKEMCWFGLEVFN